VFFGDSAGQPALTRAKNPGAGRAQPCARADRAGGRLRGVTPQGPIRLDPYGNPIVNVYIRRVERRDGQLMNVVVDTYKDVSQFWKFDPAAFLAAPVYSRDYPPAKNIE